MSWNGKVYCNLFNNHYFLNASLFRKDEFSIGRTKYGGFENFTLKLVIVLTLQTKQMKDTPKENIPGTHNLSGSEACVEGALAAGCRFFSGYPIEPAIAIMKSFLTRAPHNGSTIIQMEDEISSLAALLGAVWTGKKGLTATSGPGFSLMMENLGLGIMLETPCVIVNVQRAGTSIGSPHRPGQGDIMQARWGSHGDYEIIALSPGSPQEMFDFTIKAFNLSERYRTPVVILSDEHVARLRDDVVIPSTSEIKIEPRNYYKGPKEKYLPFKRDKNMVPPMVDIGKGYRFHVTGLTHDDRGYPVLDDKSQEFNIHPLVRKIRSNADKIMEFQEDNTADADIVIVSYGALTRTARKAMKEARDKGIRVGSLKIDTLWPFPETRVRELAKRVKAFVVAEMNYGQIFFEVERCCHGKAKTTLLSYAERSVDDATGLLSSIKEVNNNKK